MSLITDLGKSIFGGKTSGEVAANNAGNIQADAAKQAADIAAKGYQTAGQIGANGAQAGYDQFNQLFQQGQGYLSPYQQAGTTALNQQQALLGLLGPEAAAKAFETFNQSPGSQYQQQQSEKAILQNAAATGGLGGGAVLKSLQKNAQGLASQDYNTYFANIGALSNQGYNAAAQGQNYNFNGGQALSGLLQNKANILANAELGSSGAYSSGISNAAAARASGILGGAQANAAMNNSLLNVAGKIGGAAISGM